MMSRHDDAGAPHEQHHRPGEERAFEANRTEAQWKRHLTAIQYHVLREAGTEKPFTGEHWDRKDSGTYRCAGCGQPLFDSLSKFDSGTGWPSFYEPIEQGRVVHRRDASLGMVRNEVLCGRCGGHLGHVFEDGPEPTGMRYCMNSAALKFEAGE